VGLLGWFGYGYGYAFGLVLIRQMCVGWVAEGRLKGWPGAAVS